MQTTVHRSTDRGSAIHDWLESHFNFSFAEYQNPNRMGFGLLRVLNDDSIAPGKGFAKHSHQDMEIITIPLEGSIKHQDSQGNQAIIKAGEIQIMSAGTGIEHSEHNASETEYAKFLQIWIETQKTGITPYYEQKAFDQDLFENHFQLVISPNHKKGSLLIHQEAWISLGLFETGQEPKYQLRSNKNALFLFVIEGQIEINNESLNRRDAIAITETTAIQLSVITPSQILLIETAIK